MYVTYMQDARIPELGVQKYKFLGELGVQFFLSHCIIHKNYGY